MAIRTFFSLASAGVLVFSLTTLGCQASGGDSDTSSVTTSSGKKWQIMKSDAEWRKQLTPEQYRITRRKGTERAGSGEYNKTRTGMSVWMSAYSHKRTFEWFPHHLESPPLFAIFVVGRPTMGRRFAAILAAESAGYLSAEFAFSVQRGNYSNGFRSPSIVGISSVTVG